MVHMMAASRPTMTQWLCMVEAAEENSKIHILNLVPSDRLIPRLENAGIDG